MDRLRSTCLLPSASPSLARSLALGQGQDIDAKRICRSRGTSAPSRSRSRTSARQSLPRACHHLAVGLASAATRVPKVAPRSCRPQRQNSTSLATKPIAKRRHNGGQDQRQARLFLRCSGVMTTGLLFSRTPWWRWRPALGGSRRYGRGRRRHFPFQAFSAVPGLCGALAPLPRIIGSDDEQEEVDLHQTEGRTHRRHWRSD